MMPLFLVITENKAFAQLCRKALTNAGFQSSKLASTCLCNGRKSVTALSPDYVLLDGDCQDNMDDYIISLAPRYSVPIIYLTIQHNNKYPMMQAGAIDVVYKPDGTPSDNERFQKRFTESIQRLEKARANSVYINLTALRLITSVFRNALPKAYSALKKQELILLCIYLP